MQHPHPAARARRSSAQGFSLVEIAIVLVIIGLLMTGVLKGQELVTGAKAKSAAADFRNTAAAVFAYQDRFRAMPGDDAQARDNVGVAENEAGNGDGLIAGSWNATQGAESALVWRHLRAANLISGGGSGGALRNAENGALGLSSLSPVTSDAGSGVSEPAGSFFVCSANLTARLARQVDAALDDGVTDTGSVRAMAHGAEGAPARGTAVRIGAAQEAANGRYVLCAAY